jgi:hypothetical protein
MRRIYGGFAEFPAIDLARKPMNAAKNTIKN